MWEGVDSNVVTMGKFFVYQHLDKLANSYLKLSILQCQNLLKFFLTFANKLIFFLGPYLRQRDRRYYYYYPLRRGYLVPGGPGVGLGGPGPGPGGPGPGPGGHFRPGPNFRYDIKKFFLKKEFNIF